MSLIIRSTNNYKFFINGDLREFILDNSLPIINVKIRFKRIITYN